MGHKKRALAPLIFTLFSSCYSPPVHQTQKPMDYEGAHALCNYEPQARYNTIVCIYKSHDVQAADALLLVAQNPYEEEFIRGSAAYVLGTLGEKRMVKPLIEILKNKKEEFSLRDGAAVGLGKLKDRDATSALERVVYDPTEAIILRKDAAEALKRIDPEFYASIEVKN